MRISIVWNVGYPNFDYPKGRLSEFRLSKRRLSEFRYPKRRLSEFRLSEMSIIRISIIRNVNYTHFNAP